MYDNTKKGFWWPNFSNKSHVIHTVESVLPVLARRQYSCFSFCNGTLIFAMEHTFIDSKGTVLSKDFLAGLRPTYTNKFVLAGPLIYAKKPLTINPISAFHVWQFFFVWSCKYFKIAHQTIKSSYRYRYRKLYRYEIKYKSI